MPEEARVSDGLCSVWVQIGGRNCAISPYPALPTVTIRDMLGVPGVPGPLCLREARLVWRVPGFPCRTGTETPILIRS